MYAEAELITVIPSESKVLFRLPVSKTDPRAIGCTRAWQCLCSSGQQGAQARDDCPYHAVVV
jgi:hypothetical protein